MADAAVKPTCKLGHLLEEKKLGATEGWVHHRACDKCGKDIPRSGFRYHCSNGCDFNLCEGCYSGNGCDFNLHVYFEALKRRAGTMAKEQTDVKDVATDSVDAMFSANAAVLEVQDGCSTELVSPIGEAFDNYCHHGCDFLDAAEAAVFFTHYVAQAASLAQEMGAAHVLASADRKKRSAQTDSPFLDNRAQWLAESAQLEANAHIMNIESACQHCVHRYEANNATLCAEAFQILQTNGGKLEFEAFKQALLPGTTQNEAFTEALGLSGLRGFERGEMDNSIDQGVFALAGRWRESSEGTESLEVLVEGREVRSLSISGEEVGVAWLSHEGQQVVCRSLHLPPRQIGAELAKVADVFDAKLEWSLEDGSRVGWIRECL